MSDLIIPKPDGMSEVRWEITKKWLEGWLDGDSQTFMGDPYTWDICEKHSLFIDDDGCADCVCDNCGLDLDGECGCDDEEGEDGE